MLSAAIKLLQEVWGLDYKEMGQRVKNERIKHNMSREKLAEVLDLSSVFIGQIERGERKMSLDTLCKIADYLNISLDYLVNGYSKLSREIDIEQIQSLINRCSRHEMSLITDVLSAILSNLTGKDK